MGTRKNNRIDMMKHGTSTIGERNKRAKLKEFEVIKIKTLFNETNMTDKEISRLFNVSRSTIYLIRKRINWKHIKI